MNAAGKFVLWAAARKKLCAAATAAFAAVSLLALSGVKFRSDIYDIVPSGDSIISSHIAAAEKFGQSRTLFFNVSGADAESVCDALEDGLGKIPQIASTTGRTDFSMADAFRAAANAMPQTFTESDKKTLEKSLGKQKLEKRILGLKKDLAGFGSAVAVETLKSDPLGLLAPFFEKLKAAADTGAIADLSGGRISRGGNFLILAEGAFDPADSKKSAALMERVDALRADILKKFPNAAIAVAGGYRIAADNAAIASRDSTFALAGTLAVVALVCFAAFSARILAPLALLPSLVGTCAAFGILALSRGEISTIAIGFASVAVGVSVDYAVHILHSLDGGGRIAPLRAAQAASDLAKPIAITAGTTVLAFAIMGLSGCSGFVQIGIFGAAGVAVAALVAVFVMPAFAVGAGAERKKENAFELAAKYAVRGGKKSAAAAVALCAAAVPFACNVGFDGEISSLGALADGSKSDDAVLRKVWGGALAKTFVVVDGKNAAQAKQRCADVEKYLAAGGIKVFPITPILPDEKTAAENAERFRKFLGSRKVAEALQTAKKCAAENGINPDALSLALFENRGGGADGAGKSVFGKFFESKLSVSDGSAAVSLSVELPPDMDKSAFAKNLSEKFPHANYIDTKFLGSHIAGKSFEWLVKFAAAAVLAAGAYIFLITRRLRFAAAVMLPVGVGLLWTFGIFGALGMGINIVGAVFVIFAVCLAQDYAVFSIFAKSRGGGVRSAAAVLVSAITTIAAFGMLALSSHPVLRGIGAAAAVSISSILCATFLLAGVSAKLAGENKNG